MTGPFCNDILAQSNFYTSDSLCLGREKSMHSVAKETTSNQPSTQGFWLWLPAPLVASVISLRVCLGFFALYRGLGGFTLKLWRPKDTF